MAATWVGLSGTKKLQSTFYPMSFFFFLIVCEESEKNSVKLVLSFHLYMGSGD